MACSSLCILSHKLGLVLLKSENISKKIVYVICCRKTDLFNGCRMSVKK